MELIVSTLGGMNLANSHNTGKMGEPRSSLLDGLGDHHLKMPTMTRKPSFNMTADSSSSSESEVEVRKRPKRKPVVNKSKSVVKVNQRFIGSLVNDLQGMAFRGLSNDAQAQNTLGSISSFNNDQIVDFLGVVMKLLSQSKVKVDPVKVLYESSTAPDEQAKFDRIMAMKREDLSALISAQRERALALENELDQVSRYVNMAELKLESMCSDKQALKFICDIIQGVQSERVSELTV